MSKLVREVGNSSGRTKSCVLSRLSAHWHLQSCGARITYHGFCTPILLRAQCSLLWLHEMKHCLGRLSGPRASNTQSSGPCTVLERDPRNYRVVDSWALYRGLFCVNSKTEIESAISLAGCVAQFFDPPNCCHSVIRRKSRYEISVHHRWFPPLCAPRVLAVGICDSRVLFP